MSKKYTFVPQSTLVPVLDMETGEIAYIEHSYQKRFIEPRYNESSEQHLAAERRNARERQKRRAARELSRLRKLEPWRPESYWLMSDPAPDDADPEAS